jgi:branched-chain amino acid transport system ATP-binding protein
VIAGFFLPTSGKIIFDGEDITGLRADQIAKKGIARTFQQSTLFTQLTVFDNVFATFHMYYKEPRWKAFLHTPSVRREEEVARQRTMEVLKFAGLASQKDKLANTLSSGYQKMLSIAMAFALQPKLLLLDEPVTTLSPDKVEMVMNLVTEIRKAGATVIVVEHNMKAIMDYCDRIVVLAYGRQLAEGKPQEIQENRDVIEAYIGDKE